MADIKAIPLQGINHNLDKLNVQDGMCEDIVNLRLKDGSWRTSGDGLEVSGFSASGYSQFFIHTNVYRHLLAVKQGKLYWIANLTTSSNDTNHESFDFTAVTKDPLCDVSGKVFICQNGHILTVTSASGDGNNGNVIKYLVFNTSTDNYKKVVMNENGAQSDRSLYPFGNPHVNLEIKWDEEHLATDEYKDDSWVDKLYSQNEDDDFNYNDSASQYQSRELWHARMLEAFKKAEEKNLIYGPCLVVVALRMYDGSYVSASNPIYVCPTERYLWREYGSFAGEINSSGVYVAKDDTNVYALDAKNLTSITLQDLNKGELYRFTERNTYLAGGYIKASLKSGDTHEAPYFTNRPISCYAMVGEGQSYDDAIYDHTYCRKTSGFPVYTSVAYGLNTLTAGGTSWRKVPGTTNSGIVSTVCGAKLLLSIDKDILIKNADLFTGVGVFITPIQIPYLDGVESSNIGSLNIYSRHYFNLTSPAGGAVIPYWLTNISYCPKLKSKADIISNLTRENFYLLRDISTAELGDYVTKVDLADAAYEGALQLVNSRASIKLDNSAFSSMSYATDYQYMYNGRLHIANYTTHQFHGYPLDFFEWSNHSMELIEDGDFHGLKGIQRNYDSVLQYDRIATNTDTSLRTLNYAIIVTTIDVNGVIQKVVRYIPAGSTSPTTYIESLSAFMSFPDSRAKSIDVYIPTGIDSTNNRITFRHKKFDLKSHTYLNMAYYIDANLKPYDVIRDATINNYSDTAWNNLLIEANNTEHYPNGLKVSSTNNPMVFEAKHTYRVGSSEIVSMCSNAVAVGTGQTGAAPLFIFCKDGIYAMFVDSSGEMAYTNSRIIARDVCNNAKSVTPIDDGIVFTTDRGLMEISGEQVVEIGKALEGDFYQLNINKDKVTYNAFVKEQLAGLANSSIVSVDFAEFLKGAIVCYNHNERELMVSNPSYNYTYVLEDEGNWSRRDYKATEYVNCYPSAFRVLNGKFYQVDNKSDADNGMYILSREIKLDSVGFKSVDRLVARGYFETNDRRVDAFLSAGASSVEVTLSLIQSDTTINISPSTSNAYDIDVNYKDGETIEGSSAGGGDRTFTINNPQNVSSITIQRKGTSGEKMNFVITIKRNSSLGLYVYGSYDARNWSLVGYQERKGSFTDIGCVVAHPDCKFFRVCLAGQLTKDSRFDYFEVSNKQSRLSTKIR